jgi:hypothetical protein
MNWRGAWSLTAILFFSGAVLAQKPPLLPEKDVAALAEELSGETAKRTVEGISRHHRMRGSRPYRAAAELIAERARAYGLEDVKIEEFPTDGKIFYGTQRSRPPWDAEFAELWELRKDGERWTPAVRLASWDAMPLSLAQDSESADVTADLVDVGSGTTESDYSGRDVKGKIVLAAAQPGAVARLAVAKYGAGGIVSYAQNQRTAWWGEDDSLVRWGHLDTFAPYKTFGFMVSLRTARQFRERLARGEQIRLHAAVQAGQHAGAYSIVTAKISGADAKLKDEEIVFSCHLDHPRPGANDNASGCAAILEVGRTLSKLIAEGKIQRPARTMRFVWPPEIEGTMVLLNAKPEWAARVKAVIHMDMVGGGPETKAVFHVTRGPMSLPSFIYDVAEAFAEFVNEQSYKFAATGQAEFPLVAPEGGKEPLLAQMTDFTLGSDHQVYMDSSWRIPAIYLNDWPDRYIHTNKDTAAMIDPTKLKRAAFIGAASGYFIAVMTNAEWGLTRDVVDVRSHFRSGIRRRFWAHMQGREAIKYADVGRFYELWVMASLAEFVRVDPSISLMDPNVLRILEDPSLGEKPKATYEWTPGEEFSVFRRNATLKGPMSVFGYDYFEDKFGEERAAKLKLLGFRGLRGSGGEYAYEVLNFVDGRRNAQRIRDAVSAEYGPVPLEYVIEYLRALESIGVIAQVKP